MAQENINCFISLFAFGMLLSMLNEIRFYRNKHMRCVFKSPVDPRHQNLGHLDENRGFHLILTFAIKIMSN